MYTEEGNKMKYIIAIFVVILIIALIYMDVIYIGITGRYIYLERYEDGDYINISGMKIFDNKGKEIIPVAATAGSSLDGSTSAWNLLDNNDGTMAHTGTGQIKDNWLKVDLGLDKRISKVVIKNRIDCCQNRIAGTHLRIVSNDKKDVYTSRTFEMTDAVAEIDVPISRFF